MGDGIGDSLLSRRSLLAGLAATTATTVAAGSAALPRSAVKSWDISTDVLIAGSGAAGVCAAMEARKKGAQVLLIESLARFGGSSSMSGGVVYAGGGTALQKALNVSDSVEQMYRFLSQAGAIHPPLDKIQLYCEESAAHFDWLVAQGIPYSEKLTLAKGLPMGDESLYFSGTELAWPARDMATPAPRGHVPGVPGMNGGRRLMEALLTNAEALGVRLRAGVRADRLITESDGRIAGAMVTVDGEQLAIRVRRGIVLACGGFIQNREMLRQYAPQLFDCSVPWGNADDQGVGINMGIGVGAAALQMHQGFAIAPVYPPESVLSGIVVNASGQRFISEESYHGVLGDAIAYHQQGRAWLITDQHSSYDFHQDNFLPVAEGNGIGEIAVQLELPRGALQNTVAYYNLHAANGEDPLFRKSLSYLRPLQGPPYKAWDLSVKNAFFPAHTFGGLHTTIDGEVFDSFGEIIPGLYSAGRNTAGIPTAPYIASGLSVGDCTFFGRRAGRAAAVGHRS
ncbi:MAG: FAD-dependent oxidoreductase [Halioglobus sp.]|nr:FAD-dependent oxidoreductase [Halioglobus sp.]